MSSTSGTDCKYCDFKLAVTASNPCEAKACPYGKSGSGATCTAVCTADKDCLQCAADGTTCLLCDGHFKAPAGVCKCTASGKMFSSTGCIDTATALALADTSLDEYRLEEYAFDAVNNPGNDNNDKIDAQVKKQIDQYHFLLKVGGPSNDATIKVANVADATTNLDVVVKSRNSLIANVLAIWGSAASKLKAATRTAIYALVSEWTTALLTAQNY